MATDTQDKYAKSPPTIEERYSTAVNTSDLTINEQWSGAAPLLVASGIATREKAGADSLRRPDAPSIALGAALARLQSEWHSVERPVQRAPKSVRQWIEELPLVRVGERTVNGETVPIMARDKDGARERQRAEREQIEALYRQELKFLAQKLPSRFWVRERLFRVAVHWGAEEAERVVAEALRHWLDDTCQTCHGTGEVMQSDRVQVCPDCQGRKVAPAPVGAARWLLDLMAESKHAWAQSVAATSRRIHKGA